MQKAIMDITIKTILGKDIAHYIEFLAEFRIQAFRDFPYLYAGDIENERKYLNSYLTNPQAMLVLAMEKERIIGFLVGIPLVSDFPALEGIREHCVKQGLDPSEVYYCGEGIVAPAYQSKGLMSRIYSLYEVQLKKWGFKHVSFMTVKRSKRHPLKPKHYLDSVSIWRHKGFQPIGYEISLNWPTILSTGNVKNSKNQLMFWLKTFA